MSKKQRKKKKKSTPSTSPTPSKMKTAYSAGEIAMAILGGALVIMFLVIIVTSILGKG